MEDWLEDFWKRNRAKLGPVLGLVFVALGLSFFIAAVTAGACRNDSIAAHKRVAYCTISLTASSWLDIIPLENKRRSVIQLHRGIALLQSELRDAARKDFTAAVALMVKHFDKRWLRDAHMRLIATHEDPRVKPFWRARLDEMEEADTGVRGQ